ncbi:MAG: Sec-independent protein translocase subunit TatB [Rhodocyclaceae bacterium]|nr:Sec-independent protein translocase subunit TatB [Rhodocyclaceae bacterium]
MFDIGFSELVVIALVALIVIGPERLPRVARTAGALLGRFQRYVNDVKSEVRREMELEDLKKFQSQLTEQMRDVEQTIHKELHSAEEVARGAVADVNAAVQVPVDEAASSVKSSIEALPAAESHNPAKPS